jgi:hypothetical protein
MLSIAYSIYIYIYKRNLYIIFPNIQLCGHEWAGFPGVIQPLDCSPPAAPLLLADSRAREPPGAHWPGFSHRHPCFLGIIELGIIVLGIGHWASRMHGIAVNQPHAPAPCPMRLALWPMRLAPCPMAHAPGPRPHALSPPAAGEDAASPTPPVKALIVKNPLVLSSSWERGSGGVASFL